MNLLVMINLNSEQLIKLVNWIEKITARMNNVANLFENLFFGLMYS